MQSEPDQPRFDFLSGFASIQDQLACPACQASLLPQVDRLLCSGCGRTYPIVDGIPVLIATADRP